MEEKSKRRERSLEILLSEGLPINGLMPLTGSEKESSFQSKEKVIERCLCLWVLAYIPARLDYGDIRQLVSYYNLKQGFSPVEMELMQYVLSPEELEFMDMQIPDEEQLVYAMWRQESQWALMWALGYVEELRSPNSYANAASVGHLIHSRTCEDFFGEARLRSKSELLNEYDLYSCYQWLIIADKKNTNSFSQLNDGIIGERFYALKWLVNYAGSDWDDSDTWDNVDVSF